MSILPDSLHPSGRALASKDWLDAHEAAKAGFRDAVVERWRLARGARVMDIGCGPGYWTERIARAVGPEGHVTGLDVAKDLIDIARSRSSNLIKGPACNYRVASIEALDLADFTSADVVIILNVLGYMPGPVTTLARIWALLPSGTRLIVRQYDYGCTIYSHIPFDLQLRMLSALADELASNPLEPTCHAFLGRNLASVFLGAGIDNAGFSSDAVQLCAPFSAGAEQYLRGKALWIGDHARSASERDRAAWDKLFDPRDPEYILSKSDASFVTIEVEAIALK